MNETEAKAAAERTIEHAAKAVRRAVGGDSRWAPGCAWEEMPEAERAIWVGAIKVALQGIALSGTILEVRLAERPEEKPAPPGWLSTSRTHWSDGGTAAHYRSPEEQRDLLAASALNGLLAGSSYNMVPPEVDERLAERAYQLADAMMAERDK